MAPAPHQTNRRGHTRRPPALTAAAVIFALALLAGLAATAGNGQVPAFDSNIRAAVHSWASPRLTWAMSVMTELASDEFLVPFGALVVCWLAAEGRWRAGALLALSALSGEEICRALKLAFHRTRPAAFFGTSPRDSSFPSGHSIAACCFWGVLAAILASRAKPLWLKAAIWTCGATLVLLVGFSRVYLGVHYPSDVLAGYAVSVLWVAALETAYRRWARR